MTREQRDTYWSDVLKIPPPQRNQRLYERLQPDFGQPAIEWLARNKRGPGLSFEDIEEVVSHACRMLWDQFDVSRGLRPSAYFHTVALNGARERLSASLSPNHDSFIHRLVALSLRKDSRRRLARPTETTNVRLEEFGKLEGINPERDLETCPAIYLLRYVHGALFAGFSSNIRERVHLHLKYGGANVVPHSLWEQNINGVELLVAPFHEAHYIQTVNFQLRRIKQEQWPRLNMIWAASEPPPMSDERVA